MIFHVLLPPEENAFKNDLGKGSFSNERCGSHEIPHLDDLDGLGILGDERDGDKPRMSVIMF